VLDQTFMALYDDRSWDAEIQSMNDKVSANNLIKASYNYVSINDNLGRRGSHPPCP
jgi:uncharacterized protein YerC